MRNKWRNGELTGFCDTTARQRVEELSPWVHGGQTIKLSKMQERQTRQSVFSIYLLGFGFFFSDGEEG